MIDKITKMPVSMIIILVWIVMWAFVMINNSASVLSGRGLAQIENQYYRFFTAGLTHKNIIHLLVNVCAMFWIGYLYEHCIGSVKFLFIGVSCAVICQVIFLAIYQNTAESIGGSAYNFALCGFGLTMQFLFPDFPKMNFGTWSGNWLILYMIGSNIPILSFMNVSTIIFHLIAFALGVIVAFVYWLFGRA